MEQTYYRKELDYSFGRHLLTLREKAGLTQITLAAMVGLSEKAVRNWEAGLNYPSSLNLQKLIEIYLFRHTLPAGQERLIALELWEQASERANRRQVLFDESWFAQLLARYHSEHSPSTRPVEPAPIPKKSGPKADWGETLTISQFLGREQEQVQLQKWILEDHSQVVMLLGMGGIGKTALATYISQQIAPQFEFVLWRGLRNALPFENFLVDTFNLISPGFEIEAGVILDLEKTLDRLLDLLRERRCLLVLDNLETILQPATPGREFRPGYEGYSLLLRRLAQGQFQSCLLLTSRELPLELEQLETATRAVRTLKLRGLDPTSCYELLRSKDLQGDNATLENLSSRYSFNPLALKVVAESIQELFGGNIEAFLDQGQLGFDDVLVVLRQQFQRLSELGMSILYILAVERDLLTLEEIYKDLRGSFSRGAILEALKTLWRCCLIERGGQSGTFTLQPVILECVTEQLLELVYKEILGQQPVLLLRQPLLKAQAKEYIRHTQSRLIIRPLLDRLMAQFGSKERVAQQLLALIAGLRQRPYLEQGYGGGNFLNLLVHLRSNLKGLDFSGLVIWQAYLQGIEAQDADFSGCDLSDSVMIDAFDSISSVALSRDGRYLAMGSFNGTIRVWQVTNGSPLLLFTSHSHTAWSLAFSPDSQYLASAGYDQNVKLWKATGEGQGECVMVLTGLTQWVRSLAFSPDGRKIAAGGSEGIVRIWEVSEGRCTHILRGHRSTIWTVAFSPDGQFLVSGSDDNTVRLWNVLSGEAQQTLIPEGSGWVWSVAISPDGQFLAIGTERGEIHVWDLFRYAWHATLTGHTNWVWSLSFAPNGWLASGSHDGLVKIWDLQQKECLRTLAGHTSRIWSVSFGAQGLLASGGHDGVIKLWNSFNGQCLRTLQGYTRAICSVAFSPDGKFLLGGGDNGSMRLWEMKSASCLKSWQAHIGRIWALSFSRTSRLFASAGGDRTVRIWETAGGECLKKLTGHLGEIWSIAWSQDERYLASSSLDRTVRIWEVETGVCLYKLEGHTNWVWTVAFSPDSRLVASSATDGEVKIWSLAGGQCLRTFQNGHSAAGSIVFSPDSRQLLTSSNEELLKIWDVDSGQQIDKLSGHPNSNWTRSVAFSPDSALLAVGSDDRRIRIYATGEKDFSRPWRSLKGHSGDIWSVAFTMDNRYLASGSDDGTIKVWNFEKDESSLTLRSDRPYERTRIVAVTGLTQAQRQSLEELGAKSGADNLPNPA